MEKSLPRGVSEYKRLDESITNNYSRLDFNQLTAVTKEDYILDLDKNQNSFFEFPISRIYAVSKGLLIGPSGDVLTNKKSLLAEFSPQNRLNNSHTLFNKVRFGADRKLQGTALSLCSPYAQNYYHWLTQALPLLRAFDKTELSNIDYFIVPKPTKFHIETLGILGIPESRIITIEDNCTLRCDRLLVADYFHCPAPNPAAIAWVRAKLLPLRDTSAPRPDKIYLARGDAQWRGVTNERDIIALLTEHGFTCVELSKHSVLEQIAIAHSAKLVISAHGAGLTNTAFCPVDTKVLEIHPPRWSSLCYAHMASQVGLQYYYCNAEELGLSQEQLQSNRSAQPDDALSQARSINIPTKKLERFLTSLG